MGWCDRCRENGADLCEICKIPPDAPMPDRITELDRIAKEMRGENIITSSVDPKEYADILTDKEGKQCCGL